MSAAGPSSAGLAALSGKLLDIDEQKFREVVGLLEQMSEHPEVQRAFSLIRPRLAELRPRRRPNLKRVFCDPFEDLFEPMVPGERAPVARIDRELANRLWPLVEAHLGAAHVGALAARLKAAGDDPDRIEPVGLELWAGAAPAVAEAAARMEQGRPLSGLPARDVQAQAVEVRRIAHLLAIGPCVASLKRTLSPKPVHKLHPDDMESVQAIGRTVTRIDPRALESFVLVAAARMADPATFLSALWSLDFGQKSSDRAALFVAMSDSVVAQIEDRLKAVAAPSAGAARTGGPPDRMAAADLAIDLVASLEATRAAMEIGKRSEFDQRLKQVRKAVHEMVRTQVLERAGEDILAVLPDPTGATAVAPPDRATLARAENNARALRKCAVVADNLGLRGDTRAVTDRTLAALRGVAEGAFEGCGSVAAAARGGFTAIRMIELIAGPVEAGRVLAGALERARTAAESP